MSIELDLISAVSLLGPATDRLLVDQLRAAGYGGVRPAHGYVVQRLLVAPATVGELAGALGVTQQAISKSVAELVAAGYVERGTDPVDRRRQPLALSARGEAMVATMRQLRARLADRFAEAAGAEQAETARRVLVACLGELGLGAAVDARAVPLPDASAADH